MDRPSNLSKFLTATDHEITCGSEYQWSSYGPKARYINCDNDLASCHVIYDSVNQTVYEIAVQSEGSGPPANYRWINPEFLDAYKEEAKLRKIAWNNPSSPDEPDHKEQRWRDTDEVDDICLKVYAIRNGIPYDPRVIMTLHLETDLLAGIALLAHEREMTLNEWIVEMLTQEVARFKAERKAAKAAKKAAKGK